MDIVFYIIIFIIGTLLGNFYAKAINRMAKQKNIFSIHSYCSNCGKKLSILEKIPILSYIFQRGKCKSCNKKIEPIYVILEIITGFIYVITAYALKLSIKNINIYNLISFIFMVLYYTYIILTIGVDLKNQRIFQTLQAYGILISIVYIFYLVYANSTTIYINTIYLVIMILLLVLNIISTKKRAQNNCIIDLLTMLLIMLIFTEEYICILTIGGTLLAVALYILINKIKNKRQKGKSNYNKNVRIAFMMGTLNIITFLTLMNIYT